MYVHCENWCGRARAASFISSSCEAIYSARVEAILREQKSLQRGTVKCCSRLFIWLAGICQ